MIYKPNITNYCLEHFIYFNHHFRKVAKRLIQTRASENAIEMLPKRSTHVEQTF